MNTTQAPMFTCSNASGYPLPPIGCAPALSTRCPTARAASTGHGACPGGPPGPGRDGGRVLAFRVGAAREPAAPVHIRHVLGPRLDRAALDRARPRERRMTDKRYPGIDPLGDDKYRVRVY